MDKATSLSILSKVRAEKQGNEQFVNALHQMANNQIQADGLRDVRNLALTATGVGLGLRGLTGLVNLMRKSKKTRSGPAELPLPYPVEADAAPDRVFKTAGFLAGDMATTKGGMPWYGPAMLFAGLGGLAAGWNGMDYVLDKRRERERQKELDIARQDFHDALLAQYDRPLDSPTGSVRVKPKLKKLAGDESTMEKVGRELDQLFDQFSGLMEKQSIDWSNIAGKATGMYGMYAGLTGLLAGAIAYDKFKKRSRQAVLDKALQRRELRRFMQAPTEVYAIPEPVTVLPQVNAEDEVNLLKASMAKVAAFAK